MIPKRNGRQLGALDWKNLPIVPLPVFGGRGYKLSRRLKTTTSGTDERFFGIN
jgi:hypothetical protein